MPETTGGAQVHRRQGGVRLSRLLAPFAGIAYPWLRIPSGPSFASHGAQEHSGP